MHSIVLGCVEFESISQAPGEPLMSIQLTVANDCRNPTFERYLQRRVAAILGRLENRIHRVEVHLRDEGSGRGAPKKSCNLTLFLSPRGQIHVSAKNEDLYAASVAAIVRAERAMVKALDRRCKGKQLRHQNSGVRRETARIVELEAAVA
jgi:ribosome-associated translation inhibitor RaiA